MSQFYGYLPPRDETIARPIWTNENEVGTVHQEYVCNLY